MDLYTCTTELGSFRIEARADEGVSLWLDDEWLGTYPSAEAAAADVGKGKTGHAGWDRTHARRGGPRELGDWQPGPAAR